MAAVPPRPHASVAQGIGHRFPVPGAAGSNPAGGTHTTWTSSTRQQEPSISPSARRSLPSAPSDQRDFTATQRSAYSHWKALRGRQAAGSSSPLAALVGPSAASRTERSLA